jgi:hypothetical protein
MSTVNQFINVYEKIVNVIFDNGIMPSSWLIGMIKPIYYPLRKPDWFSLKPEKDSENSVIQ